jgi:hypothetical protein
MQENGFGRMISGNVIGNIDDKEFETRMKKEQAESKHVRRNR